LDHIKGDYLVSAKTINDSVKSLIVKYKESNLKPANIKPINTLYDEYERDLSMINNTFEFESHHKRTLSKISGLV
jgi:hypothetical protein